MEVTKAKLKLESSGGIATADVDRLRETSAGAAKLARALAQGEVCDPQGAAVLSRLLACHVTMFARRLLNGGIGAQTLFARLFIRSGDAWRFQHACIYVTHQHLSQRYSPHPENANKIANVEIRRENCRVSPQRSACRS